jgi:hypothetical protein
MRSSLTAAILQAWEDASDATPGERGLILLGLAAPASPVAARANFTVGQRDQALLDLYARLFGEMAAAQADCPHCSAPIELDVPFAAIRASNPQDRPENFTLELADRRIVFRLPNAGDLAALAQDAADEEADRESLASAAAKLARRCVLAVESAGVEAELSDEAARALETALASTIAAADPQAEINLALKCPACGRACSAPFDIVEFLWLRLDAFARRLLYDVHLIARAYGWSERSILALSSQRRRHYLELIGA